MGDLREQIAVVTGAASGIGKAIALSLAKEGSRICLVDCRLKELKEVADLAKELCEHVSIHKADLECDNDIRSLPRTIQKEFAALDILIHSAGVISIGNVEEACIKDFDRQYRINVRAPYFLTQGFLPMLKLRRGQVVFINSSAGLSARAGVGQYAATKHALKAVADGLREEVNANGIRVISVYPGRTAGPMQAALHKMEKKAYLPEKLMQPADVARIIVNALSLPRTAEVTDIHVRPMTKT